MNTSSSKRAIITGATKGIGRALAHSFAAEGFDLAICSRNITDLRQTKIETEEEFPGVKVFIRATDISQKEDIRSFAAFVLSNWKSFDVLINNAGVYLGGTICDEQDGQLEKLIATNLYSAYRLTRALVPTMKIQEKGHIFNMCSIASKFILPDSSSYCISKFALLGFSNALREELKNHKIRVTAILPGATWSDAWKGATFPDDRLMKASDIADAVVGAYKLSKQTVIEELLLRPQLGDI